MQTERQTVSANRAMEILGVSRATVSNLVRKGDLEAYKLTPARNSPYRIYLDSIQALLRERQQSPE